MQNSKYAVCLMHFSLFCFLVSCSNSYAQESLGELIDCTDVSIDYSANSSLTQEERILQMDKALFQSLNKFELCQSAGENENAAEATGGGESEGAAGGGGAPGGDSVASSTMSGTDVAKTGSSSSSSSSSATAINTGDSGGNLRSSNGKLPEDIPPADNDDALAAQIRYAAENEANSVKKEQLWNEYRKYKGLSVKKEQQ